MKIKQQTRGFTIIELLVVATIIAVLVAIGSVSFANAGKSARNSKRKADLETVRQALVLYKSDNAIYPDVSSIQVENKVASTNIRNPLSFLAKMLKVPQVFAAGWTPPPTPNKDDYNEVIVLLVSGGYLSSPTPVDPKSGQQSCGVFTPAECNYKYGGNDTSFTLIAPLEGAVDYTVTSP